MNCGSKQRKSMARRQAACRSGPTCNFGSKKWHPGNAPHASILVPTSQPLHLPACSDSYTPQHLSQGWLFWPLFRRVDIFCEFCTEILKMLGSLHKLNWIMLKMDSPAIINDMFSHVYLEIIQIIKICDRTGMVHKNWKWSRSSRWVKICKVGDLAWFFL